jgi:hypothetical protein
VSINRIIFWQRNFDSIHSELLKTSNTFLRRKFKEAFKVVTVKKECLGNHYRTGWPTNNALDSYSGGTRFESRPGHHLY